MLDGRNVDVFTLLNSSGVEVRVITYGATIVTLRVPDRDGNFEDIVLGFDTLEQYLKGSAYFGAIVGRYANRIARGRFTLKGKTYQLAVNNGANHLHGGIKGFDKVLWNAHEFRNADGSGLALQYLSTDGEEGYPGNLNLQVAYTLTDRNELAVDYSAKTDQATPINLSQHTYFNLAGDAKGDVLDHELRINADYFTPVDNSLIPTGAISPVEGTPFDFRRLKSMGENITQHHEQLSFGSGYDHNFVLNSNVRHPLAFAAQVIHRASGRVLDVSTTEPGVQFYTGNLLDSVEGKAKRVYQRHFGFCLETQHFPDSPNNKAFPTTILLPGQTFHSQTVFTLGCLHS
jgi:aldose 1-epimerase